MSRKRLVNQGMMMIFHFDPISPSHYKQGSVECIEALASATANLKGIEAVCTANAIKYLWRWKEKNGMEDLKKAHWYIERLIQTCHVQPSQPPTPFESNL
jgi:hypothetical protein